MTNKLDPTSDPLHGVDSNYPQFKAYEKLVEGSKEGFIYIPMIFEVILDTLNELKDEIEKLKQVKK